MWIPPIGSVPATLAGRVALLRSRILVLTALPLDFAGKLRVLRSTFLPGALHGIDSLLALCERLGPLLFLRSGLGGCLLRILGLCGPVWMGLLVLLLGFMLFGLGFGFFVGLKAS